MTTNLDRACKAFGWAGGTIHQVAKELGLKSTSTSMLIKMPPHEFQCLLKDWASKQVSPLEASLGRTRVPV